MINHQIKELPDEKGWIVGDSGTIIHTSDGGKTWISQNSRTNNNVVSVFFLNRNLGWAASQNYSTFPYGTMLLKTTNGGAYWSGTPFPVDDIFITCILYRDSLNGWMGGSPNVLVKTMDGGITWVQAGIDTSTLAFFPVLSIKFLNEKYGYACGGLHDIAGVIWRTSNRGDLWQAIDPSEAPADEVHGLYIFGSLYVKIHVPYFATGIQYRLNQIGKSIEKTEWVSFGQQNRNIWKSDSSRCHGKSNSEMVKW